MSAFTSLRSAIFPWRRGSATPANSEPTVDMSPTTSKKLSADAPEFIPSFMKAEQLPEVAAKADKSRFPWQRQISNATDLDKDESLSFANPSNRQTSTLSTASTCASVTPDYSSGDSNIDRRSSDSSLDVPSDDEEAVEKRPDAPKDPELAATPQARNNGLKVSANSWAAALQARRRAAEQGAESLSHEEIVRKMKSILNKLTIEKFPTLSKQLTSCGIRSTSHLEALIHEICEKATTQHHFVNMYADLCSVLQAHFASYDSNMNFKKILLNACQASFEKHLTPPASLKTLIGEELAAAEQLYKVQMIGNIKFVGALIVRKMLAVKVMFAIIEELLSDPTSEALESLAALLTVIGPAFDQPDFPQQFVLGAIFDQVEARTRDSRVKHRVRCLLKDVLELRASGWQDRKPKKLEGPSTLEEVAQKVQFEAQPEIRQIVRPTRPCPERQFQTLPPKPEASKMELRQSAPQSAPKSPCNATQASNRVQASQKINIEAEPCSPSKQNSKAEPRRAASKEISVGAAIEEEKATNALKDKLKQFLESNGVDEEAAEDLKACPAEIQEMVLAKGDVTSARNPSAMLRVRMNQAWRELKKKTKAAEPPCRSAKQSPDQSQASAPKSESAKSSEQPKKKKEKANEVHFDKAACHKQLAAAYAELMTSHDVPEAVTRIASVEVPPSVQPEELSDFLVFIMEQGVAVRAVGFKLIVSLFQENCWTPAALQEGLRSFSKMFVDLKLDVPTLPKILCKEMVPAFKPLVHNGLLASDDLQALSGSLYQ